MIALPPRVAFYGDRASVGRHAHADLMRLLCRVEALRVLRKEGGREVDPVFLDSSDQWAGGMENGE